MPEAAIPLAFQAFSSISQASGQARAGKAAARAGSAAREQAEANARVLEKLGRIDADEERRASRRLISSQRAAFARAGVRVGTGSALDVMLDAAVEGEVAALRRKFGLDSQAFVERTRGIMAEFSGQAQQAAARTQAGATLLTGAARGFGFASQAGLFRGTGASRPPITTAPLVRADRPLGAFDTSGLA